jgi:hypothetical protein
MAALLMHATAAHVRQSSTTVTSDPGPFVCGMQCCGLQVHGHQGRPMRQDHLPFFADDYGLLQGRSMCTC